MLRRIYKGYYDSDQKQLTIEYKSPYLKKYESLFLEIIERAKETDYLNKGLKIKKVDDFCSMIIIPCDINVDYVQESGKINNVPSEITEHVGRIIETFTSKAIDQELENLEFIPLSGYSIKKLQEEIDDAVKDKRDLVLIDTFENYLKLASHETLETNQKHIKYLGEDYADVAYILHTGNKKELKKYESELKLKEWD